MSVDIKVKGLKELSQFLQQLPTKIQNNILRGALNAGAKVIKEEAKRNVPVDSGKLRDGIKTGTRLKDGIATAKVKTTGKHGFLALWMEHGTAAHEIVAASGFLSIGDSFAREVHHPGFSPKPFMRPALETQASAAGVAAAEYMKKRITKAGIEDASDVDVEPEDNTT